MKQNDKILDFMETHGSITNAEGYEYLNITKTSTRVSEMIRAGVKIDKQMVSYKKQDGTLVRYMRYFLVKEQ